MDDIERIKQAIDSRQERDELALAGLADLHDERGENVAAEGYRILLQKGRWPLWGQGRYWRNGPEGCFWETSNRWGCSWATSNGWRLQKPESLPCTVPMMTGQQYAGASEALEAAVLPVAWHERGWKMSQNGGRRLRGGRYGHLPCDPPPEASWATHCVEYRCGPLVYGRAWEEVEGEEEVGHWHVLRSVLQTHDGSVRPDIDPYATKILLTLWLAAGGLPKSAPPAEKKARKRKAAPEA